MTQPKAVPAGTVQQLQIAETLLESYRQDVIAIGAPGSKWTMDDRLLALDQNYAGLWNKLDEVRELVAAAQRDTSDYDQLRAQVTDLLGYKEKRALELSLDGVSKKVTITVNRKRVQVATSALAALRSTLPEAAIVATNVRVDPEVARFMSGERKGRMATRAFLRAGVIVAVVGAIVGVVYLVRPADYGRKFNKRIRVVEKALRNSPCDKKAILKLADTLNEAKAYKIVIERAGKFFERCGEYRRLRWATFTAYKRLADYRKALEEVTRLIKAVPHDSDYRWWRAQVHTSLGDRAGAIEDYRQAVALQPSLRRIPFSLANELERAGRPCEALFWIRNYLHHHPKAMRWRHVKHQLQRLEAKPKCAALAGTGQATIAIDRPTPVVVGTSGQVSASMAVRQWRKRLFTTLSETIAKRASIRSTTGPILLRQPLGGLVTVRLARADLRVGDAMAKQVWVAIVPDKHTTDRMQLGRSFFERFTARMDEGTLVLETPSSLPTSLPATP